MRDRVLLVDDEEAFTELLAQRMESRGIDVDVALDGANALEQAKDTSYDAIFVDLMMPGMDGMETCRKLLEINPDLQVILLTGRATVERGVEAMKLGAVDFLEKPADMKKLLERIQQAKAKKMLLVEEKKQKQIERILKTKGW